jgi:hypothetical protein
MALYGHHNGHGQRGFRAIIMGMFIAVNNLYYGHEYRRLYTQYDAQAQRGPYNHYYGVSIAIIMGMPQAYKKPLLWDGQMGLYCHYYYYG